MLILIEHWKEHNIEHASTYKEWAEKVGEKRISETLSQIARATTDINLILEKLKRMIGY